ncbi:hypothetical protein CF386_06425 [Paraphotobacterium marinum]|uniref:Porin n=1 Tax=Paraphotobacterium marinum TaxID=1755811 RepID=A0A220VEQ3_9GAMM|nr:hypothetical protein [Paraphotobacterium marinum]ASK78662.1 hypothetical protein CF386_06425 [Paraphotobacterium marinum]
MKGMTFDDYEHASKGSVYNLNYMNTYIQGKSYFSEHSYGIGYFYTRIWGSSVGVAPRSLYAGIGDDRYGQLVYGFMYGALSWGEYGNVGLNWDCRSATSIIPQPFQKRTKNTIGYNFNQGNFYLKSTFSLSDGNYHESELKIGSNNSGYKGADQVFLSYALDNTGVTIGGGGGFAQIKTPEGNYGTAWMTEADLKYSNSNWFFGQTFMLGKSITSGISGIDQTGQYVFGKATNQADPMIPDPNPIKWGTSLARFAASITGIKYTSGQHQIGLEYDYGQFYDYENSENLKIDSTKKLNLTGSNDAINQVLLTYNHVWNKHMSAGVEYIYDLISKKSSYHQGNGLYAQVQYTW